jgi:hypothetical protein
MRQGGNPFSPRMGCGLPHQSADWFAMTTRCRFATIGPDPPGLVRSAVDASQSRARNCSMIPGRFFLFHPKTLRWFSDGATPLFEKGALPPASQLPKVLI